MRFRGIKFKSFDPDGTSKNCVEIPHALKICLLYLNFYIKFGNWLCLFGNFFFEVYKLKFKKVKKTVIIPVIYLNKLNMISIDLSRSTGSARWLDQKRPFHIAFLSIVLSEISRLLLFKRLHLNLK